MSTEHSDFYARLREKLLETTSFPTIYLYKFIIENKVEKQEILENIFKEKALKIDKKTSSSAKFISFSIQIYAQDTEEIIEFYKKAGEIEGIVSL